MPTIFSDCGQDHFIHVPCPFFKTCIEWSMERRQVGPGPCWWTAQSLVSTSPFYSFQIRILSLKFWASSGRVYQFEAQLQPPFLSQLSQDVLAFRPHFLGQKSHLEHIILAHPVIHTKLFLLAFISNINLVFPSMPPILCPAALLILATRVTCSIRAANFNNFRFANLNW